MAVPVLKPLVLYIQLVHAAVHLHERAPNTNALAADIKRTAKLKLCKDFAHKADTQREQFCYGDKTIIAPIANIII